MNGDLKIKEEIEDTTMTIKKTIMNLQGSSLSFQEKKAEVEKTNALVKKCKNLLYEYSKNASSPASVSFKEKVDGILQQQKNALISVQNSLINHSQAENEDEDDEEAQMIPKMQVQNLNHLIESRNKSIQNIYKKTLLVNQIAKEVNEITNGQEKSLETIEDNIQNVKLSSEDTHRTVLKRFNEIKNEKNNKCCILLFLSLLGVIVILYYLM